MRTIKVRLGNLSWAETTHYPPYDDEPLVVTREVNLNVPDTMLRYCVTHRQTGCAITWRQTLEEAKKDRTLLLASDFDWAQHIPLLDQPDPEGRRNAARKACNTFLPDGWRPE